MKVRALIRTVFLTLPLVVPAVRAQVDLVARYPATLDWTENNPPVEWSTGPEDVWALSSFSYELDDKFRLETGPASVVFGRSGTSALFAAIFPGEPGRIAVAPQAQGEGISGLWIRFNPSRLGDLFPVATVTGPGPEPDLIRARRVAAWKMDSVWMQDRLPTIPPAADLTFDIETPEGERHVFSVNTDRRDALYEPFYGGLSMRPEAPISPEVAVAAFDTAWRTLDERYPAFSISPGVDWAAVGERGRAAAAGAASVFEVAQVIADAAALLRNPGITVAAGQENAINYKAPRPLRASFPAMRDAAAEGQNIGPGVMLLRRADGIGQVVFTEINHPAAADAFASALDVLSGCWALIIDLRFCTAANEPVARLIAGRLVAGETVYALSRERNGHGHGEFAPPLRRTFKPWGAWRWEAPVVVLTGRLTCAGSELLTLMLRAAGATTVGDNTGGVPAETVTLDIAPDIRLTYPARLDLPPDSNEPFWRDGLAPDLFVEDDCAYAVTLPADRAYNEAVRRLLATPEAERKPGKR